MPFYDNLKILCSLACFCVCRAKETIAALKRMRPGLQNSGEHVDSALAHDLHDPLQQSDEAGQSLAGDCMQTTTAKDAELSR